MRLFLSLIVASLIGFIACNPLAVAPNKLPIIGERDFVDGDTVFHTVPAFTFVNQNGKVVTDATFAGKAYIVDYFFTSCPTICPKVKQQEMRVADYFQAEDRLKFLSVSIDTKYDSIPRLKWYADKLEIRSDQWHMVTGEEELIYEIDDDFFHTAIKNDDAPGGYDHDGLLILVDKDKQIRSFANGLEAEEVDRFIKDIENLLTEM